MTLVETSHPGEGVREGARRWLLEMRDRFSASDPGLGRLRGAIAVSVSVGSALVVQRAVAHAAGITGVGAFAMTLFGAVVAMLGSNALSGMLRREMVPAAAGFPVAVAIGLVLAVLTDVHRGAQVLAFAAVLFTAVWVRRFGGAWSCPTPWSPWPLASTRCSPTPKSPPTRIPSSATCIISPAR